MHTPLRTSKLFGATVALAAAQSYKPQHAKESACLSTQASQLRQQQHQKQVTLPWEGSSKLPAKKVDVQLPRLTPTLLNRSEGTASMPKLNHSRPSSTCLSKGCVDNEGLAPAVSEEHCKPARRHMLPGFKLPLSPQLSGFRVGPSLRSNSCVNSLSLSLEMSQQQQQQQPPPWPGGLSTLSLPGASMYRGANQQLRSVQQLHHVCVMTEEALALLKQMTVSARGLHLQRPFIFQAAAPEAARVCGCAAYSQVN